MSAPKPKTEAETMADMQAFLDSHGIKHFKASEVLYLGDSNRELKLNHFPRPGLWPNIIPTLKILDRLRNELGPLQLLSIYRSPAYNKAIGGARYSQHMDFTACDVKPLSVTVRKLWEAARALRKTGAFKGGVGRYPTFVHIDTRGQNADF